MNELRLEIDLKWNLGYISSILLVYYFYGKSFNLSGDGLMVAFFLAFYVCLINIIGVLIQKSISGNNVIYKEKLKKKLVWKGIVFLCRNILLVGLFVIIEFLKNKETKGWSYFLITFFVISSYLYFSLLKKYYRKID